jgi:hypothetical protein
MSSCVCHEKLPWRRHEEYLHCHRKSDDYVTAKVLTVAFRVIAPPSHHLGKVWTAAVGTGGMRRRC